MRLIKIMPVMLAGACMLWASSAHAWHAERVKRLAHQVEDKARHVHRQAEIESRRGTWDERQAILALHQLENDARHFHRQVETYYSGPEHTRHDFRRLMRTYRRASDALHWAHFSRHVMRDFWLLEDAIYDLQHEYGWGGGGDHGGGHGGGHGGWWDDNRGGHWEPDAPGGDIDFDSERD